MIDREDYTELRTLPSTGEILRADFGHDEAWIRVKGYVTADDQPIPDDQPLAREAYLGPFYIYDFD